MDVYGQTTHSSTKQTVRKTATGRSSGLNFGAMGEAAFLRYQMIQRTQKRSSASSHTEDTTGMDRMSRST